MATTVIYGTIAVNHKNHDLEFFTPGDYIAYVAPGRYMLTIRGAGGAGGETVYTQAGGAGGKGEIMQQQVQFTGTTKLSIHVGAGGQTGASGNGGAGGALNDQAYTYGGRGGGGGEPSWAQLMNGNNYFSGWSAVGGGGGGGAGGSDIDSGRYSDGGSGGGGGGRYTVNIGIGAYTLNSIAGKDGGNGGRSINDSSDVPPTAGVNGDTTGDFANIISGDGGSGNGGGGAIGAYGAGASGGGGGYGTGNHSSSRGGPGGGGAGGDLDAGGGETGIGAYTVESYLQASNQHTVPTDTIAENAEYGVTGDYGLGGTPDTAGKGGFVILKKIR